MSTESFDSGKFNKTVANNSMVSMASTIIYLVTSVVRAPVCVHYLGMEVWGIWAFSFVITGYLGMGAFGIGNVYIRYSAMFYSKGDINGINKLLSTGLSIVGPCSVLALIVLWYVLPGTIAYFNIDEANREMTFTVFYATAMMFLIELTFSAFAAVLNGLQKIASVKLARIVATLTETVLQVVLMVLGFGYYALLIAFLVRISLFLGISIWLTYKHLPEIRIGPRLIDTSFYRYFWSYGGALQLNGMLGMLAGSLDRILFLKFFGEKVTGFLDLGQKFPRMAVFIPETISGAIYPAVTQLQQGDHGGEIEKLYIRGCRYINLIISVLMGFMAPFAAFIMLVWLGPDQDLGIAPFLMMLFTLPFHGHVFTGPASAVFKGIGKPFQETHYPVYKLLGFVVFVGATLAFAPLTAKNIAIASAAAIFFSTVAYVVYANIKLKVSTPAFLKRALLPGMWCYGLGIGMVTLLGPSLSGYSHGRWPLAFAMLPTGLAYLAGSFLLIWFLALDVEEKQTVIKFVRKRLKRN